MVGETNLYVVSQKQEINLYDRKSKTRKRSISRKSKTRNKSIRRKSKQERNLNVVNQNVMLKKELFTSLNP